MMHTLGFGGAFLSLTKNMGHKKLSQYPTFFLLSFLCLFNISCGKNPEGVFAPRNLKSSSPQLVSSQFIIGDEDWREVGEISSQSPIRKNSHAVGNLLIERANGSFSRCTAFLVSENMIMTNNHCVANRLEAASSQLEMGLEKGKTPSQRERFSCPTLIHTNADLDMSLLQCQGQPGYKYGMVKLSAERVNVQSPIYVLHQNCNHERIPSCTPYKKYSPGKVLKMPSEVTGYPYISYDADTLQGSSGSPVFSAYSHAVVVLNNVGLYHQEGGDMVGNANGGIPMYKILAHLQRVLPHLSLGH